MNLKFLVPVVLAFGSVMVAALPSLAESNTQALANARDATAIYSEPTAALAAGYELLTDAQDIACIDMPGQGGMGVHYVKSALVQSGVIDAARPQALVYEVGASGRLHLVALEYVVLKSTWDAAHSSPPTLFGEQFMLTQAGNRFGLPAFYSLHAWIWKHNPGGTFNPWNPDVRCGPAVDTDGDHDPMMTGVVNAPEGDW